MKIPDHPTANGWLERAGEANPGRWVDHSRCVARAAEAIARVAGMDADAAWCAGLLHDIGRVEGVSGLHHAVAGHAFLCERGYPELGRICLTHSFPLPDINTYIGVRDVTREEEALVEAAFPHMDDMDRLIQLCDAICTADGVVLMEVRLVDVALRHGAPPGIADKWREYFCIKRDLEQRMGRSIYDLFPEARSLSFQ